LPELPDVVVYIEALEKRILGQRLEAVRNGSLTPPEHCFEAARKKIADGHYDFAVDAPVATTQV